MFAFGVIAGGVCVVGVIAVGVAGFESESKSKSVLPQDIRQRTLTKLSKKIIAFIIPLSAWPIKDWNLIKRGGHDHRRGWVSIPPVNKRRLESF